MCARGTKGDRYTLWGKERETGVVARYVRETEGRSMAVKKGIRNSVILPTLSYP